MQSVDFDCHRCRRPRNGDRLPTDRARLPMTHSGFRGWMCVEHFRTAHALANLVVEAKERDTWGHRNAMFSGDRPDIFGISFDRTPVAAKYPLAKTWMSCPPGASSLFFFVLFFSLFIRWLIHLFSPSPLVLLYFYSLSPTADLYSPVYRPLPLSKFHTVLPSCIEWTYPTSICHDQQCYNYQSAILKSIILKYFINVIYIFFIFDSIQILIIFDALLIADSLISL